MASARRYRAHPGWHAIGGCAVAAWLGVLVAMFSPSESAGELVDLRAADADEPPRGVTWMGVYFQGRKLGYLRSTTRAREGGGYAVEQQTHLRLRLAGTTQPLTSRLEVALAPGSALETFAFELSSALIEIQARGRVAPRKLQIEGRLGSEPFRRELPIDEPPLFELNLPAVLIGQDLRPGRRYRAAVFDPQALANRPVEIEVVGHEAIDVLGRMQPVVHFRRRAAGAQIDSWIALDGVLVREQVEGGWTLVREEGERAMRGLSEEGVDAEGLLEPFARKGKMP
ncbi:MAG: hypothetical protein JXR96_12480 [Deltaproteobacteria bacterium]|nr:hypothetical protein [Deltaproteobacteria bacterium]